MAEDFVASDAVTLPSAQAVIVRGLVVSQVLPFNNTSKSNSAVKNLNGSSMDGKKTFL